MGRIETLLATRRAALLSCVSAALLVLALAGCGESKTQKQADQYADGLCTSIQNWQSNVLAIAGTLRTGSPRNTAEVKLNQAKVATLGLVNEIHALQVPSTSNAEEAKQDVDVFVVHALASVASIGSAVKQLKTYGDTPANVASVTLPVAIQLTTLVKSGKDTVTSLKAVKAPFDSAVKKSKACSELTGSNAGG